jgi:hypothetical protein
MTPTMKFIRKDNLEYFTMTLPSKAPKTDHGIVTKSSAAWALPRCLFGTSSAIAASLRKW